MSSAPHMHCNACTLLHRRYYMYILLNIIAGPIVLDRKYLNIWKRKLFSNSTPFLSPLPPILPGRSICAGPCHQQNRAVHANRAVAQQRTALGAQREPAEDSHEVGRVLERCAVHIAAVGIQATRRSRHRVITHNSSSCWSRPTNDTVGGDFNGNTTAAIKPQTTNDNRSQWP